MAMKLKKYINPQTEIVNVTSDVIMDTIGVVHHSGGGGGGFDESQIW